MSSLYANPGLHPGTSAAVPSGGALKTPPPPELEIPARLNSMDPELHDLHDAIDQLSDRLCPVLRERGPENETEPCAPIVNTDIGKRVFECQMSVRRAAAQVRDLIARLEI